MDRAIQIVAAAASGKTSTIVIRVRYALKKLVSPKEILILAFNRSVQKEIETRIKECLGNIPDIEQITIKTSYAFGLYVIGDSVGREPRSVDWIEPPKDIRAISDIVEIFASVILNSNVIGICFESFLAETSKRHK